MLTEAESLFEQFCDERALPFRRLPEGDSTIPDYELQLRDVTVAVEIKQLDPNVDDQEHAANFENRETRARFISMGRVRQKLRVGAKQLKSYTKKNFPGIVILFDTMGPTGCLDPMCIAYSMYGENQTPQPIATDRQDDPWIARLSSGGKRAATDTRNTSLSAVALLRRSGTEAILSIDVFHNRFAAHALPVELLRYDGVRHFAFASWDRQTLPSWVEV